MGTVCQADILHDEMTILIFFEKYKKLEFGESDMLLA